MLFVTVYVGNLQPGIVGRPQDAHHMLFVTVYVGNLQPGKTPGCLSYAVRYRVCWQPTAWNCGKTPGCPSYAVRSRVCWQPTAWENPRMPIICCSLPCMLATYSLELWEDPRMPIICCSQPCMLATYSLGKPQDAYHMLFVTVYVGNLQPGKTPGCLSYAVRYPVCWQPTAWNCGKTPGCPSYAVRNVYVGNLQPGKTPGCLSYAVRSRVCWQPITWKPLRCQLFGFHSPVMPYSLATYTYSLGSRLGSSQNAQRMMLATHSRGSPKMPTRSKSFARKSKFNNSDVAMILIWM